MAEKSGETYDLKKITSYFISEREASNISICLEELEATLCGIHR